jgi:hypothetical protein
MDATESVRRDDVAGGRVALNDVQRNAQLSVTLLLVCPCDVAMLEEQLITIVIGQELTDGIGCPVEVLTR